MKMTSHNIFENNLTPPSVKVMVLFIRIKYLMAKKFLFFISNIHFIVYL